MPQSVIREGRLHKSWSHGGDEDEFCDYEDVVISRKISDLEVRKEDPRVVQVPSAACGDFLPPGRGAERIEELKGVIAKLTQSGVERDRGRKELQSGGKIGRKELVLSTQDFWLELRASVGGRRLEEERECVHVVRAKAGKIMEKVKNIGQDTKMQEHSPGYTLDDLIESVQDLREHRGRESTMIKVSIMQAYSTGIVPKAIAEVMNCLTACPCLYPHANASWGRERERATVKDSVMQGVDTGIVPRLRLRWSPGSLCLMMTSLVLPSGSLIAFFITYLCLCVCFHNECLAALLPACLLLCFEDKPSTHSTRKAILQQHSITCTDFLSFLTPSMPSRDS